MRPGARLMIVEDETATATELARVLTSFGYNVVAAAGTHAEAVRLVNQLVPELILIDINLGQKFSGIDAAHAIRQQHNIPIVYLTDCSDAATRERGEFTKPDGYLLKPLNYNELQFTIDMALYKHQAETAAVKSHAELELCVLQRTAELEVLRRRYEVILNSAGEGIYGLDTAGNLTFINPAAAKMLGYDAQQMIGSNMHALVHCAPMRPDCTLEFECPISAASRQGVVYASDQDFFQRQDGSYFPVEYTSTPKFSLGARAGTVVVFRDITLRRRAQQAERYVSEASRIFGNSLDLPKTLDVLAHLAVTDLATWCAIELLENDGSLRHVVAHRDPAHRNTVGTLRTEILARRRFAIGWGDSFRDGVSELYPTLDETTLRKVSSGEDHFALLQALSTHSAMVIPLRVGQKILGILTLAASSDQHIYDAEDVQLAEQLAHRAALAIQNAMLYQTATEAIRVRDEFLSVASHELRTPLTSLMLQVQLLQRRAAAVAKAGMPLDNYVLTTVQTCIRQTDKLTALMNDLLDVTRIRSGRMHLRRERTDLAPLVTQLVEQIVTDSDNPKVELSIAPGQEIAGSWDSARIEQVLTNLLSNAIKYGAGRPIAVDVRRTDAAAIVTVRDRGAGVAESEQSRIFERFERAGGSENLTGLGLGLYITRQIVEAHGGNISLQSSLGEGSTFTVELPIGSTAGVSDAR